MGTARMPPLVSELKEKNPKICLVLGQLYQAVQLFAPKFGARSQRL
jgi:hypothetical protein